jgi:hypothetical protein
MARIQLNAPNGHTANACAREYVRGKDPSVAAPPAGVFGDTEKLVTYHTEKLRKRITSVVSHWHEHCTTHIGCSLRHAHENSPGMRFLVYIKKFRQFSRQGASRKVRQFWGRAASFAAGRVHLSLDWPTNGLQANDPIGRSRLPNKD